MKPAWENGKAKLYLGDCLDVMKKLEANSVDSVICDPPYGLDFMDKHWDHGVPGKKFWEEAFRVAKPGSMLMAFGGTRTVHRLTCAIEDAGWIIRDQIVWAYGSGFPKSANISKQIDRQEQNRYLKICKAIDNLDICDIIEIWKKHSKTVRFAEPQSGKTLIEVGTSMPKSAFVPALVLLSVDQKRSNAPVIIAELSSSEARHTSEETKELSALTNVEGIEKQNRVKYVDGQPQSDRAMSMLTGIVPYNVKELQSGKAISKLKAAEALKIWLGSKKSSSREITSALCVALTNDLKLTILSQSKTFQSLDTISKTDFASAISVTIMESTAALLISYMADILKSKQIDKAAGAEREVIGHSEINVYQDNKNHKFYTEEDGNPDYSKAEITAPATEAAKEWDGWGTALKPAMELIVLAMKPLEGTFAENAQKWGVAGLWIDGGRIGDEGETVTINTWDNGAKPFGGGAGNPYSGRQNNEGRWPANLIHDGSPEVVDLFPSNNTPSGKPSGPSVGRLGTLGIYGEASGEKMSEPVFYGDTGSAVRFFYCAKASQHERGLGLHGMPMHRKAGAEFRPNHAEKAELGDDGNPYGRWNKAKNFHPTVKPLELMKYLCRLTRTPTGGVVLDPFMGSGTTGMGAVMEMRKFIGIELEPEYFEIAVARIKYACLQPRLF